MQQALCVCSPPEKILRKMRQSLVRWADRFDAASLNPDAVDLVFTDPAALQTTVLEMMNWVNFIDNHFRGEKTVATVQEGGVS